MARHKPRKTFALVRYQKDEITEEMIVVAEERIRPHLLNMGLADYDLKRILVDVYLQGCRDMAETIVNERLKAEL